MTRFLCWLGNAYLSLAQYISRLPGQDGLIGFLESRDQWYREEPFF